MYYKTLRILTVRKMNIFHNKLVSLSDQWKVIDNINGTVLLRFRIHYGRKKFYETAPGVDLIKLL
jgi:hypothetical protein